MIDALRYEIRPQYGKNPGLKRLFHRGPTTSRWRKLLDNRWKSLQPLRDELPGWARRFGLIEDKDGNPAEWFLDATLNTLLRWEKCPAQVTSLPQFSGFASEIAVALSPEEGVFKFSESWEPGLQTKQDFEKACKAWFKEALQRFTLDIHDLVTKRGWEKTPTKHIEDMSRDLAWLVRRQVRRESFESIARVWKVERSAVERAVTRLRSLISLAPLPAGRPRNPAA